MKRAKERQKNIRRNKETGRDQEGQEMTTRGRQQGVIGRDKKRQDWKI